ncbi:MAG: metallophosphoesterase [bacterium]|nr:metallophosphoesterase [bacterium]MCP5067215.1 metallophosphoesterase [bacterium]
MSFLRTFLLANVFRTLAFLLGGMQALVFHWFWVVVLGHPAPPWPIALGILAFLVTANVAAYAPVRWARRRGGVSGMAARSYMTAGVATLLLGLAVAVLWAFALPAQILLGAFGISPDIQWGWFQLGANVALLAAVGVILWGVTLGQARYDQTAVRLPVTGLDPSLSGLRVVQLSDLHIGNKMDGKRLERFVEDVNAMQPDLLVLTGDLFDFDPAFVEQGARALSKLRARLGVFAVLGNHDMYTGSEFVAEGLAAHAPCVRLLRSEFERLHTDAPLYLAGIDDPGRLWISPDLVLDDLEELGTRLPTDGPVILLSHRPDAIVQAARLGFAAVLSGHTHGGQIALPGMAARVNLARLISRYPRGLFQVGETSLYVNRGAGVAGPAIRIAAPREIATLELRSVQREPA